MRIAVMSDVHGFSLALQTVLDDVDRQGPFDEVIVAGDLCEVGPAPAEVVSLLRQRDFTVLRGNTDRDVVEAARTGRARSSIGYAVEQVGEDGVRYLASLPFDRRITPPGGQSPVDDLLVVHANPHNLTDRFDPAMSDRELLEVRGDVRAAVIAFGHIHIAYIRRLAETILVDVSAVGNSKDGDLRCKYGILTWDESIRAWSVDLRRLPYPVEETAAQIRASNLPDPERVLAKLLQASY